MQLTKQPLSSPAHSCLGFVPKVLHISISATTVTTTTVATTTTTVSTTTATFISSDRSSYSDDVLLYIYLSNPLFQISTQSLDAIDVTSVTLTNVLMF